jgi:hydrogenase nickel incorporation protein HypA/HybF
MHELAITEGIVSGVLERMGEARISRVIVEVGELCAVVPDAIRFCFELCAQGTSLEGAVLELVIIPGRGKCRTCGTEVPMQNLLAQCSCGGVQLDLQSGQELRVRAVEVN